jgi:hypothetical protein
MNGLRESACICNLKKPWRNLVSITIKKTQGNVTRYCILNTYGLAKLYLISPIVCKLMHNDVLIHARS